MDDQMSTPISSIYPQQHVDTFPPPPQVQSNGQNNTFYSQMQQHMQQQSPQPPQPVEKKEEKIDTDQQELMFLFVIVLVVSSEPMQRQLMTSFPSLFSDSKTSIVATAINAGVVCALFYALRRVKITV